MSKEVALRRTMAKPLEERTFLFDDRIIPWKYTGPQQSFRNFVHALFSACHCDYFLFCYFIKFPVKCWSRNFIIRLFTFSSVCVVNRKLKVLQSSRCLSENIDRLQRRRIHRNPERSIRKMAKQVGINRESV